MIAAIALAGINADYYPLAINNSHYPRTQAFLSRFI